MFTEHQHSLLGKSMCVCVCYTLWFYQNKANYHHKIFTVSCKVFPEIRKGSPLFRTLHEKVVGKICDLRPRARGKGAPSNSGVVRTGDF